MYLSKMETILSEDNLTKTYLKKCNECYIHPLVKLKNLLVLLLPRRHAVALPFFWMFLITQKKQWLCLVFADRKSTSRLNTTTMLSFMWHWGFEGISYMFVQKLITENIEVFLIAKSLWGNAGQNICYLRTMAYLKIK